MAKTGSSTKGSAGGGTPAVSATDESSSAGVVSAVGTSTNYARQDHTHGTESLALSQTVLTANFIIPANTSSYIVDSLEIANGVGLEVASGGALEVG